MEKTRSYKMSKIVPKIGDYYKVKNVSTIFKIVTLEEADCHHNAEVHIKYITHPTKTRIGRYDAYEKGLNSKFHKLCNFMNSPLWKKLEGLVDKEE